MVIEIFVVVVFYKIILKEKSSNKISENKYGCYLVLINSYLNMVCIWFYIVDGSEIISKCKFLMDLYLSGRMLFIWGLW